MTETFTDEAGGTSSVFDYAAGTLTVYALLGGSVISTRPLTSEEMSAPQRRADAGARLVNESGILAKLAAAITANNQTLTDMDAIVATVNTFLALTAPTTAQRNAFIADMGRAVRTVANDQKKQTRQLTALARLAVRDLTTIDGT
jgi:hypothetical protein